MPFESYSSEFGGEGYDIEVLFYRSL